MGLFEGVIQHALCDRCVDESPRFRSLEDIAMPDYFLEGLDSRRFEHLVQSIAQKVIASGIQPFADGPDGGREATFSGKMMYPSLAAPWDGYLVIQCKFKQKLSHVPQIDGNWVITQLRSELKQYQGPREHQRLPEFYLFVTNVPLTSVLHTGTSDRANAVLQEELSRCGISEGAIWSYDNICRYLDGQNDIANTFRNWIRQDRQIPRFKEEFSDNWPRVCRVLHGRDRLIERLDGFWESPETNLVCVSGSGGIGKTSAVMHWYRRGKKQGGWRDAERVFAWSFYGQGTTAGANASAHEFVSKAIDWFEVETSDYETKYPHEVGCRIANSIAEFRTLLILDGLEPFQVAANGKDFGRIRDDALRGLISTLVRRNNGLCFISSRVPLPQFELDPCCEPVCIKNLAPHASVQLLRELGVKGPDGELRRACRDYGYHAFSLELLGNYLKVVYDGDVLQREKIPPRAYSELDEDGQARRMLDAYCEFLGETAGRDILKVLGLFDRPVEWEAIEAVASPPPIENEFAELRQAPYSEVKRALAYLERLNLLWYSNSESETVTLDCHPIIRHHFRAALLESGQGTWRECNRRLMSYFEQLGRDIRPTSLAAMRPLFQAIVFGCKAGEHVAMLRRIFKEKIARGRNFTIVKLGGFVEGVEVFGSFFDKCWTTPKHGFTSEEQYYLFDAAGFGLRGLGRLQEAAIPIEQAVKISMRNRQWRNASQASSNLSKVHINLGCLWRALASAKRSVRLARRCGDRSMIIGKLTTLGYAHLQLGEFMSALKAFRSAERMQSRNGASQVVEGVVCSLTSAGAYRFCLLLIQLGKIDQALSRAKFAFQQAVHSKSLSGIGLGRLAIAKCMYVRALAGRAEHHDVMIAMDNAVADLRSAGRVDLLPEGLLARCAACGISGEVQQFLADVNEIYEVAWNSEMLLYRCELHLTCAEVVRQAARSGDWNLFIGKTSGRFFEEHGWSVLTPGELMWRHLRGAKDLSVRLGYKRLWPRIQGLLRRGSDRFAQ